MAEKGLSVPKIPPTPKLTKIRATDQAKKIVQNNSSGKTNLTKGKE